MGEITKQIDEAVAGPTDGSVAENQDITSIASHEDMATLFQELLKSYDEQLEEATDSYNLFKDMVANGGDFDSSGVVKEQISFVLKAMQDARDAKMKLFQMMLQAKAKRQQIVIKDSKITQNNFFGGDRRALISAIENLDIDMADREKPIDIQAMEVDNERDDVKAELDIKAGDF